MPNITINHAVTHTNIMGDELHLKSLVFDMFIKLINYQLRTSHAKILNFGLSS